MKQFTRSDNLWERGRKVLAGGPATLSKHPERFALGVTPKFAGASQGWKLIDVDGYEYIDTVAGLGPILIGHGNVAVNNAVIGQVNLGSTYSLPSQLEVEVAEMMVDLIPCAEQVRFCKNGSDATEAAVRLARHITGKRQVFCSGYHGFHDWYIASTDLPGGILPDMQHYTHQFAWHDDERLHKLLGMFSKDLAAIIVEVPPCTWDDGTQESNWIRNAIASRLYRYKDFAHENGALFILDEVVTGFRYSLGGAQEYYGVMPDLACFGKAMANGYSLAALAGPAEYMQYFANGKVFFSSTNGGNAIDLAAAKATLDVLQRVPLLENLHNHGRVLGRELERMFHQHYFPVQVLGNPARIKISWLDTHLVKADELLTLWMSENVQRGVLYGVGVVFPMACYTQGTIDKILEAAWESCAVIKKALEDPVNFRNFLPCPPVSVKASTWGTAEARQ